MATQWALGLLHSIVKSVSSFYLVVHSVGVSEYEHYSAKAKESL